MRVILIAALAACASAASPTNLGPVDAAIESHKADADNGVPIDGPASHHDAPVAHDAPPDAFVSHNADADTTGGLCSGNADCTTTGECCFAISGVGLCTPGTVIGTACLPN